MNRQRWLYYAMVIGLGVTCAAASARWPKNVPERDRSRSNSYTHRPESAAAGAKLFGEYCAQCHGADALGRGKRPSLRTREVQQATDGEIFWLLKNGNRPQGMPSWSSLPEPSRWQIIAYLKSLGVSSAGESPSKSKERQ